MLDQEAESEEMEMKEREWGMGIDIERSKRVANSVLRILEDTSPFLASHPLSHCSPILPHPSQ